MTNSSHVPVLVVNAFTDTLFGGNPAAVVETDIPLADGTMQSIAEQHNLSETAFLVRKGVDHFHLRWFTPAKEVPLCGHATLASAYALDYLGHWAGERLTFDTASGPLYVTRDGDRYRIEFPAVFMGEVDTPDKVAAALGVPVVRSFQPSNGAWQMVCELADEATLKACSPDFSALAIATDLGVSITAASSDVDYVSRFFIPQLGINEDPVTGSAHCQLVPLWAARFSKTTLRARQLSARGGELSGTLDGDRVVLAGQCCLFSEGRILLPSELV
ncbi:phenazine biosynthesis protein PhzF family [gamma proteobacterium HIMB55]|nr:phenazine biosynthesis protein PhzF family [gamma proteobacterium HIMB55]